MRSPCSTNQLIRTFKRDAAGQVSPWFGFSLIVPSELRMLMQPILGRADGLNAVIPVDDDGQPVFYPMNVVTGSMQQFRIPLTITEGPIDRFRVRFFGAPMSTGSEGFARVSSACPIPNRPG